MAFTNLLYLLNGIVLGWLFKYAAVKYISMMELMNNDRTKLNQTTYSTLYLYQYIISLKNKLILICREFV